MLIVTLILLSMIDDANQSNPCRACICTTNAVQLDIGAWYLSNYLGEQAFGLQTFTWKI